MHRRVLCVAAVASVVLTSGSGALAADTAPCAQTPARPWCDTSLDADARAHRLTEALTDAEKLRLLAGAPTNTSAGAIAAIPRLGVPAAQMAGSTIGVSTPIRLQRGGRVDLATQMPSGTALGASFDPDLARRAGATVGDEARRKGFLGLLAPASDLLRVGYFGRTFESFSEDPRLSGELAAAWIQGAESAKVFTSLKHFAVNNQEGRDPTGRLGSPDSPLGLGVQGSRYVYNAVVSERALREIYLAPFEQAVREGNPGSIMCSYNRVNGPWACASRHLLTDVLRDDWGFRGLVMSDWVAAAHLFDTVAHLRGGLDLEMPSGRAYDPRVLRALLRARVIHRAVIDEHVRRILRTTISKGVLDEPPLRDDRGSIDVDAHAADAQAVAEGGAVLLRNSGVLPLRAADRPRIAVLGPAARALASGGGSSAVRPYRSVSIPSGLAAHPGAGEVTVETTRDPARAAAVARSADVAIVVAADYQTEGADRLCLSLRCPPVYGDQDALIEAVAAAQPKTVVVLQTGGPVLTPWRERVAAILQAWYPGESGGTAVARVLFGDTDASGRLPMTFPASEADLPTAGSREQYPGDRRQNVRYREDVLVGYRWYDARGIAPAYPFGFGLSYTTFAYSGLRATRGGVSFDVRNTGTRRGAAVPQLYVGLPPTGSARVQPPWQLRGAAKLWLDPGEQRAVSLPLTERDLSTWDGGWRSATGCVRVAVGASSRDLPLRDALGPCAG